MGPKSKCKVIPVPYRQTLYMVSGYSKQVGAAAHAPLALRALMQALGVGTISPVSLLSCAPRIPQPLAVGGLVAPGQA